MTYNAKTLLGAGDTEEAFLKKYPLHFAFIPEVLRATSVHGGIGHGSVSQRWIPLMIAAVLSKADPESVIFRPIASAFTPSGPCFSVTPSLIHAVVASRRVYMRRPDLATVTEPHLRSLLERFELTREPFYVTWDLSTTEEFYSTRTY